MGGRSSGSSPENPLRCGLVRASLRAGSRSCPVPEYMADAAGRGAILLFDDAGIPSSRLTNATSFVLQ